MQTANSKSSPIYQEVAESDSVNFHSILILLCLLKNRESIIYNRIFLYLVMYHREKQTGFQKDLSRSYAIPQLIEQIPDGFVQIEFNRGSMRNV